MEEEQQTRKDSNKENIREELKARANSIKSKVAGVQNFEDIEALIQDTYQLIQESINNGISPVFLTDIIKNLQEAAVKLENTQKAQALANQWQELEDQVRRAEAKVAYEEFNAIHSEFLNKQQLENEDLSNLLKTGELSKEQEKFLKLSQQEREAQIENQKDNWKKINAAHKAAIEQEKYVNNRIALLTNRNTELDAINKDRILSPEEIKEQKQNDQTLIALEKDLAQSKAIQTKTKKHYEERDKEAKLLEKGLSIPKNEINKDARKFFKDKAKEFKDIHGISPSERAEITNEIKQHNKTTQEAKKIEQDSRSKIKETLSQEDAKDLEKAVKALKNNGLSAIKKEYCNVIPDASKRKDIIKVL